MAVFNLKSTLITNRDATPKVLTDNLVSGGMLKESEGYVASAGATDSAGTTYRLCTVPSRARVSSVVMQNTAFGAGAAFNVGVYWPSYIPFPIAPFGDHPTPADAGTVISANFFANALSVAAAAGPTDVVNQSGTNTIAKQEMSLWQAIGLTADPGLDLDIVVTIQTAIIAAGFVGLKVRYQS